MEKSDRELWAPERVHVLRIPRMTPMVRTPEGTFRPWMEGDPAAEFVTCYHIEHVAVTNSTNP